MYLVWGVVIINSVGVTLGEARVLYSASVIIIEYWRSYIISVLTRVLEELYYQCTG